ncbi:hypothetical protein DFH07DRAFT_768670 [Mycena maculata]|uniref:Uncharacterized protein n=1 Tax=Mycena maculata TaxID=230809 RepID=A0AAD7JWM0_9AGAR|nr:hypothetical protein DFH07DRAFT_768670 [Mycena maculata]
MSLGAQGKKRAQTHLRTRRLHSGSGEWGNGCDTSWILLILPAVPKERKRGPAHGRHKGDLFRSHLRSCPLPTWAPHAHARRQQQLHRVIAESFGSGSGTGAFGSRRSRCRNSRTTSWGHRWRWAPQRTDKARVCGTVLAQDRCVRAERRRQRDVSGPWEVKRDEPVRGHERHAERRSAQHRRVLRGPSGECVVGRAGELEVQLRTCDGGGCCLHRLADEVHIDVNSAVLDHEEQVLPRRLVRVRRVELRLRGWDESGGEDEVQPGGVCGRGTRRCVLGTRRRVGWRTGGVVVEKARHTSNVDVGRMLVATTVAYGTAHAAARGCRPCWGRWVLEAAEHAGAQVVRGQREWRWERGRKPGGERQARAAPAAHQQQADGSSMGVTEVRHMEGVGPGGGRGSRTAGSSSSARRGARSCRFPPARLHGPSYSRRSAYPQTASRPAMYSFAAKAPEGRRSHETPAVPVKKKRRGLARGVSMDFVNGR